MSEGIDVILEWIKTISKDMNSGFDRVVSECKEAITTHSGTCEVKRLVETHLKDHEKLEKKKIQDLN